MCINSIFDGKNKLIHFLFKPLSILINAYILINNSNLTTNGRLLQRHIMLNKHKGAKNLINIMIEIINNI